MRRIRLVIGIITMLVLTTTIGFGVSAIYKNDEIVVIPENHLARMSKPTKCIVADLKTEVLPIEKPEVVIVSIEELINSIIEELIAEVQPIEKPEVRIVTLEKPTTTEESTTKVVTTNAVTTTKTETTSWNGKVLNKTIGTVNGPSGKETYYNLNMSGVIRIMRNMGYSETKYPYHIREDGVKMLGPYIMCAANLNLRPRGTILETSLGKAIVCDTGEFAKHNQRQLDIAVNW